jgi:hypothetical protein
MEPGGRVTDGEDGGVASTGAATAAEDDDTEVGVAGAKEGLRSAFPQAAGVDDFETFSACWYGSLNA